MSSGAPSNQFSGGKEGKQEKTPNMPARVHSSDNVKQSENQSKRSEKNGA